MKQSNNIISTYIARQVYEGVTYCDRVRVRVISLQIFVLSLSLSLCVCVCVCVIACVTSISCVRRSREEAAAAAAAAVKLCEREMAKKKRGTGSGKRSHRASEKITKTRRNTLRFARGDDLVWQDLQTSAEEEKGGGDQQQKQRIVGACGDTGLVRRDAQPLDGDLPGSGQFYCVCCSRYFTDANALAAHKKTKPHKRRMKELGLGSARPHTQADAEAAAGMGPPDNGKKKGDVTMSMAA